MDMTFSCSESGCTTQRTIEGDRPISTAHAEGWRVVSTLSPADATIKTLRIFKFGDVVTLHYRCPEHAAGVEAWVS